jgi:menaquinone-dependent protoporphyrinogen oxidase
MTEQRRSKIMKTLILYATKYGAAEEIAQRIAKRINGAVIHDLKQSGGPDLAAFDCIIIGTSVYAGMIRKEAKTFAWQNANVLREKKLGLFLSGMGESGEKEYFEKNFPPNLLQSAKAANFLGGVFDPKKANFIERLIMKIVTKQSGYLNNIDDSKIERFVEAMKV